MTIVTPFGQLDYGSDKGLAEYFAAHDTQHRMYNQILALRGLPIGAQPLGANKITKDWLLRNLTSHIAIHNVINSADPNSESRLFDTDWDSERSFYDWHQSHDDSHAFFDQVFAIAGNSF